MLVGRLGFAGVIASPSGVTSARPRWVTGLALTLAGCVFLTLVSLGNWQVRRLQWKQELIANVEARAFAEPIIAPRAPTSSVDVPEYTRVKHIGVFQHENALRVKAVTELGPGYWLMTPLKGPTRTLWVNRGFIPTRLTTGDDNSEITEPKGEQEVIGWVRPAKPNGTWLEKNDPVRARWYSADLVIMSDTVGITAEPTYYIDAEGNKNGDSWPRGGMTKLTFRNTHLAYALTWYAMAALLLAGVGYAIRDSLRKREQ